MNPCPSLKKSIEPEDKGKIEKSLFDDEKITTLAKAASGLKGLTLDHVLLIKGLLDKKVESIATELGIEKSLVKEVVYELFKSFKK